MLDPSLTKHWAVDPAKIAVRLFTYPNGTMPVSMLWWLLKRFPEKNIAEACLPDLTLPCARNITAAEFLQHEDLTHLLLVDNDVRPDPRLDLMFQGNIPDLVCASWESDKHWYADRTCWHMSFAMARKEVFLTLDKPWFAMDASQDGFSCSCDCRHLSERARQAGFTTGNQGWCDHKNSNRAWCGR